MAAARRDGPFHAASSVTTYASSMTEIHLATDVFVAGNFPELTYNDRIGSGLGEGVERYLVRNSGGTLIVHGPSKTGKTVLIEKWLPQDAAIWIKGDEITSVDDLYRRIIDDLGLFTEISHTASVSGKVGVNGSGGLGLKGILKFRAGAEASLEAQGTKAESRTALSVSVVKARLRQKPVPIVIDDFHFIDPSLRLDVARAVKDIARYTRVVLIAIPHAAFSPLRDLQDMNWRVTDLPVGRWEPKELEQIAHDGFNLLGVVDHGDKIAGRLAGESRKAPAIMQAACLDYVLDVMQIDETAVPAHDAVAARDWGQFFHVLANNRKPSAFDILLEGKKTRGRTRIARTLVTGDVTDIYGAILRTLSKMGAPEATTKKEIAARMAEVVEDAPKPETISKTLKYLADIAEQVRGDDDPALTYQDPNLHLLDPFFAFYLAHGRWELPPFIAPQEESDDEDEDL